MFGQMQLSFTETLSETRRLLGRLSDTDKRLKEAEARGESLRVKVDCRNEVHTSEDR